MNLRAKKGAPAISQKQEAVKVARLHVERWGASHTHTEDEEQLNEHGAEGQDPSHEDAATENKVDSAQTPAIGKPIPLLSISTENAYIVAVLSVHRWELRMVGDLPKVQALIIFYFFNTTIPHGLLVLGYWVLNLE